jgi:hypothetical protein
LIVIGEIDANFNSPAAADRVTWIYDPATDRLAKRGPGDRPTSIGLMAYDAESDRAILFAADSMTWAYHARPALAVSVEHFVRNPSQRPDHHRGPASTRLGSLLRGAASGRCVLGAGDESRTRDLNVGNVALYQLSYSRVATPNYSHR